MPNLAASLPAIEEIKQLKARYFRGIDTKDEALLASVFCADATCDFRGGMEDPRSATGRAILPDGEYIEGGDRCARSIIEAVRPLVTVHHGHMPEIRLTSEDTATGIWAMVDHLAFPEGSEFEEVTGWGHYHETYRREEGEWKIATLRLERLRVDIRQAAV